MARDKTTYPVTTHCKNCNEKFGESVQRAGSHRLCKSCYTVYQRWMRGYKGREEWKGWSMKNREDVYKVKRDELMEITQRDEWLKVIRRNLDTIITEIP